MYPASPAYEVRTYTNSVFLSIFAGTKSITGLQRRNITPSQGRRAPLALNVRQSAAIAIETAFLACQHAQEMIIVCRCVDGLRKTLYASSLP